MIVGALRDKREDSFQIESRIADDVRSDLSCTASVNCSAMVFIVLYDAISSVVSGDPQQI